MLKKIVSFKHLIICTLIITIIPAYAYTSYSTYDSLVVNVVFKLRSQKLDLNFRSNKDELDKIKVFYLVFNENKDIKLITISHEDNLLSNQRIGSIVSYLEQNLSDKGFTITTEHRENADRDIRNKDYVIFIKDIKRDNEAVRKIEIVAYKKKPQNIVYVPTTQKKYSEIFKEQPLYQYKGGGNVRLGANVIYALATVANVSCEVNFAERFAFETLCTFSPWNINSTTRLRTLIIQPEFKIYFKSGYEGHHIGLEGHLGWYNVSLPNSTTRYQDANGNTPGYGGGITYGYYIPISKNNRWGMDLTIGAGYTHLDYDCFYNVTDGIKYDRCRKDIWGLTKIGVIFYLNFNAYK